MAQEVIELLGVGFKEALSQTVWGRELLEHLFPGFGDMQVSADADAASGAEAKQGESYEVVDVSAELTDIQPPTPEDFRDPESYLRYLRSSIQLDIDKFNEMNQSSGVSQVSYVDGKAVYEKVDAIPASWFERLHAIDLEIEKEMHRFGGPRASSLTDFYSKLQDFRVQLRQA